MWAQIINTALGIWLMAAPAVLGYGGAARTNDHIVGPIAATLACIALWSVTRPVRWVNLPLGLWLLLAPWILSYDTPATINSSVVGLALAVLSIPQGRRPVYGGGWSMLWKGILAASPPAS